MQEQTSSSKAMKVAGIPHHDCSKNYFLNELCGGVAIFTNPQTFIIRSGVWGAMLTSHPIN
jgi:hypothetical protein